MLSSEESPQSARPATRNKGIYSPASITKPNQFDSEPSSDESEQEEQYEEEVKRNTRKSNSRTSSARKPRKSIAKSKKYEEDSDQENRNEDNDDISLFEIINTSKTAIESVVSEWIESYNEDHDEAMVVLINFIVKSCGCPGTVDQSMIEEQDNIAENLQELQNLFDVEKQSDYPLIQKKGSKKTANNKFRTRFLEFWSKWFNKIKRGVLFQDQGACIELVKNWLVTMSSSVFRPFRHTSCIVSLSLVTCLSEFGNSLQHDEATAERQLEIERSKKSGNADRVEALVGKINDFEGKIKELEQHMKDFFTSVFVHRYRDSDPIIRAECITELGIWILKYSQSFLGTDNLKYVGWMLYDKVGAVRQAALKTLSKLYANENMISGLQVFSERFKGRYLDMALRDIDSHVNQAAIELLVSMGTIGLLDDRDQQKFLSLLFTREDIKSNEIIAKYFAVFFREEIVEPRIEELESENESINEKWVAFKCLAEFLVSQLNGLNATSRANPSQSQSQSQTQSQDEPSQDQAFSFWNQDSIKFSQTAVANAKAVNDDSLDFDGITNKWELKDIVNRVYQRDQLIRGGATSDKDWCNYVVPGERSLSGELKQFKPLILAVLSLYEKVDFLKDWKALLEYLVQDFSNKRNEDISMDDEDDQDIINYGLSEQEEYALILVLNCSLSLAAGLNPGENICISLPASLKKLDKDAHTDVSRELIKTLPNLIKKYSGNFLAGSGRNLLIESVLLIKIIDIHVYIELRLIKWLDLLVDDIEKIFMKHSSRDVLQACCSVLGYLMGSKKVVDISDASDDGVEEEEEEADAAALTKLRSEITTKAELLSVNVLENIDKFIVDFRSDLDEIDDSDDNPNPYLENIDMDIVNSLLVQTIRLDLLTGNSLNLESLRINNEVSQESETSSEEDVTSLFSILNSLMDATLMVFDYVRKEDNLVISLDDFEFEEEYVLKKTELRLICDHLLELSLSMMSKMIVDDVYHAVTEVNKIRTVGEPVTAEQLEDAGMEVVRSRIESYKSKSQLTIKAAEAVIVRDFEEIGGLEEIPTTRFPITIKLTALELVMSMYGLTFGPVSGIFPGVFDTNTPADVEEKSGVIIARVIDRLCFEDPWDKNSIATNNLNIEPPVLNMEMHEMLKTRLSAVVETFLTYASADMIKAEYASPILAFYGLASNDAAIQNETFFPVGLFGTSFDKVVESSLQEICDSTFATLTKPADSVNGDEQLTCIADLVDLIKGCFEHSLFLYFTGRSSSSVDPSLKLTKLIISNLKQLTDPTLSNKITNRSKKYIILSFLNILKIGGEKLIQVLRLARRRQGEENEEYPDESFMEVSMSNDDANSKHFDAETCWGKMVLKFSDLKMISLGWRIWGAFGGFVQQLVTAFNVDLGDSNEISNIGDVAHYISRKLTAARFIPVESDAEWSDYYLFTKAISKGDSNIVRRGVKKGKGKVSKPKAKKAKTAGKLTGAPKKPKKTPAKKAKKVTEDVGDSDDGGEVEVTQRRRSGRKAAGVKTYNEDKMDVDMDAPSSNDSSSLDEEEASFNLELLSKAASKPIPASIGSPVTLPLKRKIEEEEDESEEDREEDDESDGVEVENNKMEPQREDEEDLGFVSSPEIPTRKRLRF